MEPANRTDQLFNKNLKDYSAVPPPEVKEAVLNAINRKRSNPYLVWTIGTMALLIVILAGYTLFNGPDNGQIQPVSQPVATLGTEDAVQNPDEKTDNQNQTKVHKPEAGNNQPDLKSAENQDSKSGRLAQQSGLTVNTRAKSNRTSEAKPVTSVANNKTETTGSETKTDLIEKQTLFTNTEQGNNESSLTGTTVISKEIPANQNTTEEVSTKAEFQTTESLASVEELKTDAKTLSAFSISINAGPSFFNTKYAQNKSGNSEYTNAVENAEENCISFNAGIEFGLQLKGKVFVQTGINYDYLAEKFNYTNPQSGPGTSNEVSATNKYEYLSVPVLLGFTFEKNKFSIKPQGGISFMMLMNASGYTIDYTTNEAVAFDKNSMPLSDNLLAIMFRLEGQYNLNDHIGISLQPAVRFNTKSAYSMDYPVGKELTRFSINAGFNYRF